jgi:DNA-binding transcriptional ArsR family regulator
MSDGPNVSATAALIGDPTRAAMLSALLDGKALPAGELAYASGVTAQTASAHLAKLVDGGLLESETEGRHRYYRLAGPHVAQALEVLAAIRPLGPVRVKPLTAKQKELRFARRCYDHLAGELGVAVTHQLLDHGLIIRGADKSFSVTFRGVSWFQQIGIDVGALKPGGRAVARQCLDWTERTHHLGGPLGVALLEAFSELGWLRRSRETRAIQVTLKGQFELRRQLGVEVHLRG